MTCTALSTKSYLACLILEGKIASQFCISSNGFRPISNRFHLIDTMSGGNRLASGVVFDEGSAHTESVWQAGPNAQITEVTKWYLVWQAQTCRLHTWRRAKSESHVMNEKQRLVVEFIKKGRQEIKFDLEEKDNKLTMTGQGELPWPAIIIGRNGGVTISVRSYNTSKKSAAQWALEADQLLLKQATRNSKKARRFGPLLENFRFFAFAYLNDWWQYDRHFVAGLSLSSSRDARLYWISEAANYYQVSRRFPKTKDGAERLGKVLDRLDRSFNRRAL